MAEENESKVNAMEVRSLDSICGVSRKCRNSDVRKRRGLKEDVVTRVERTGVEAKTIFALAITSVSQRRTTAAFLCKIDPITANDLTLPSDPLYYRSRLPERRRARIYALCCFCRVIYLLFLSH
ncbi:hypothetical protein EVAR_74457_1 [Eumeta japonica]|uniref:Uncharacterized protein n=1 Tax=Eumeta variegata TaxID=151549 RepID=A0A4C1YJV4_EUMVA|nr:hypothetical protein EVAR_74457_1 [Eumeta japonica]